MVDTEKAYMQFVPKMSGVISELNQVRGWLRSQKRIKRYCEENPQAYSGRLELMGEAEKTLYRAIKVFMKGEPASVR